MRRRAFWGYFLLILLWSPLSVRATAATTAKPNRVAVKKCTGVGKKRTCRTVFVTVAPKKVSAATSATASTTATTAATTTPTATTSSTTTSPVTSTTVLATTTTATLTTTTGLPTTTVFVPVTLGRATGNTAESIATNRRSDFGRLESLVIEGTAVNQSIDCDGRALIIRGSNHTITARRCQPVLIDGSSNNITLDTLLPGLTILGDGNTVGFSQGEANFITIVGNSNSVRRV